MAVRNWFLECNTGMGIDGWILVARVGFAQSPSPKGFSLSLCLSFPLSQSQSLTRAPPESGLSGENGESKGCLHLVDNSILPPPLWQAALLSPPPIAIEGEGMGVFLPGLPIPHV